MLRMITVALVKFSTSAMTRSVSGEDSAASTLPAL